MAKDYNKYIGVKINHLTPIKFLYKAPHYRQVWLCQCDCGTTCATYIDSILSGNTKSCGHLRKRSTQIKEKISIIRINRLKHQLDKHNTTGYTGVYYDKCRNCWIAQLVIHGKKYRERYKTKNEAINARKKMEELYWK